MEQQARLGVDKFGRVLRRPADVGTSRGSSRWFQQQGSGPAAAATGQQQRASLSALQMLQKQIQTERIGTELAETVLARELGNLEAMEAELQRSSSGRSVDCGISSLINALHYMNCIAQIVLMCSNC